MVSYQSPAYRAEPRVRGVQSSLHAHSIGLEKKDVLLDTLAANAFSPDTLG